MSASLGQPPLGSGAGLSAKQKALAVAGVGLVIVGASAWYFWPAAHTRPDRNVGQGAWGLARTLEVARPPPAAVAAAAPKTEPAKREVSGIAADPPAAKPHLALGFYALGHQAPPATTTRGATEAGVDDPDAPGGAGRAPSEYAQRMQSTSFGDTIPVPPKGHPWYTIAANYEFDCLPNRPIASNLPGPIKCAVVNQPVWSEDPNNPNPLLPLWTEIDGTLERGLATGEDRLFLVTKKATTPWPQHFEIPLDGVVADPLGQIGVKGDRDDHLWPKTKMTLIMGAIQLGTSLPTALAQQGNHNTSLNLGGIGTSGQSLAEMAFQHDMNIPTTVYRGPGQPIKVITTHAIDLVNYYRNGRGR